MKHTDEKHRWDVSTHDSQLGVIVRMKSDATNGLVIVDLPLGVFKLDDRERIRRRGAEGLTLEGVGELVGGILRQGTPTPRQWLDRCRRVSSVSGLCIGMGVRLRFSDGLWQVQWRSWTTGALETTYFATEEEAVGFAALIDEDPEAGQRGLKRRRRKRA